MREVVENSVEIVDKSYCKMQQNEIGKIAQCQKAKGRLHKEP